MVAKLCKLGNKYFEAFKIKTNCDLTILRDFFLNSEQHVFLYESMEWRPTQHDV